MNIFHIGEDNLKIRTVKKLLLFFAMLRFLPAGLKGGMNSLLWRINSLLAAN